MEYKIGIENICMKLEIVIDLLTSILTTFFDWEWSGIFIVVQEKQFEIRHNLRGYKDRINILN